MVDAKTYWSFGIFCLIFPFACPANLFVVDYTMPCGISFSVAYHTDRSDSRCPRSLLKTTPPPPGYPLVSGGLYVTTEPKSRGLVLDHQL